MAVDPNSAARRLWAASVMEPLFVALRDTDPTIRQHHTARWEMTIGFYRAVRLVQALATLQDGQEEPTAEEIAGWQISPGDMVLGLPITEAAEGKPRIVSDAPPPIRLEDYLPVVDASWLPRMEGR